MNYLKVAQSCKYANLSKSTLKRILKDLILNYALTPDDTPEAIQEKTNEVRKVVRGNLFHWEYSIELLDKIKKPLKIRSEENEPTPEAPEEPKKLNEPTPEPNEKNEIMSTLIQEIAQKNKEINELHQLLEKDQTIIRDFQLRLPPPRNNN